MQHNCCTVRHSGQMLCTSIQRCHPIDTKLQEKRHHHSALSHHHFYSTLFYKYSLITYQYTPHYIPAPLLISILFHSILLHSTLLSLSSGVSVIESFEKEVKPRELEETLRLEYRSKFLNPKWAEVRTSFYLFILSN